MSQKKPLYDNNDLSVIAQKDCGAPRSEYSDDTYMKTRIIANEPILSDEDSSSDRESYGYPVQDTQESSPPKQPKKLVAKMKIF